MWSSNTSVPSLGKGGQGGGRGEAGRQQQAVFLPSVVFASHLPHLKLHPGSCLARGTTREKEGDCTSFFIPCSSPTHLQPRDILSPSLFPSNPHSILISISIPMSSPSCPHSCSHSPSHLQSHHIPSLSTSHLYIHPIPTVSPSHLQPHPIPISTPSHPSYPHSLPTKGSPSAPNPTEGGSPRRSERAQHWGPRGPSSSLESSQGCRQCGEAELSTRACTQSWVSTTFLVPEALLLFPQLQAFWGHSVSL